MSDVKQVHSDIETKIEANSTKLVSIVSRQIALEGLHLWHHYCHSGNRDHHVMLLSVKHPTDQSTAKVLRTIEKSC